MDATPPGFSFTIDGHRGRLVTGGEERIALLVEMIEGAKKRLQLVFYDMADDDSGTRIRDTLVDAAARGVDVSLMIDGFGLIDLDDHKAFFAPLRDEGAKVHVMNPSFGRRYFLRNHQKIVVVDHERCLVGGANLAHDYLMDDEETCWRDLWLWLEGKQAGKLGDYVDALWGFANGGNPRFGELSDIVAEYSQIDGPLQWKLSGPWPRHTPWPTDFVRDLWKAKQVDIIAAYFSPPKSLKRRLWRVSDRGGKVRLLTPAKSDNNATIAAARFTYGQLIAKGVDVYEYQRCKLHTKLAIIDDSVFIGSSNFDFRSLFINMELMLRIKDREIANQFRAYVDGELEQAEAITHAVYKERATLWRRILWRISNFLTTTMDYTVSRRLNFPLGDD